MTASECPFCHLAEDRIWLQTDVAVAFLDQFPVSPGHTLIIPEHHIGALLELPENDLKEIWSWSLMSEKNSWRDTNLTDLTSASTKA